jgi:hypothetical protein
LHGTGKKIKPKEMKGSCMKLFKLKRVITLFSICSVLLLSTTAFAEMKMMKMDPNHKVPLTEDLQKSLEKVLESTSNTSETFFKKEQVGSTIPVLSKSLMMAQKQIKMIKEGELLKHKKHLGMVIMQAMKASKGLKNADVEKAKEAFLKVNQKLTQIIKYFKVDENYRLFFCSKMKKVWISKTAESRNPYNSSKGSCGKIIAGKKI